MIGVWRDDLTDLVMRLAKRGWELWKQRTSKIISEPL